MKTEKPFERINKGEINLPEKLSAQTMHVGYDAKENEYRVYNRQNEIQYTGTYTQCLVYLGSLIQGDSAEQAFALAESIE